MDSAAILEQAKYFTDSKVPVYVFEHGTVLAGAPSPENAKYALQQIYDVPHDGEGSPRGDMQLLDMDDGSKMISFDIPIVFAVVSKEEYEQEVPLEQSETERFGVDHVYLKFPDPKALALCLRARKARGEDARAPKIVEQFIPKK